MVCVCFLFIAAFGVLVALMALMGLFLGAAGPDLRGLLIMLLAGLPVVLLATGVYIGRFRLAIAGASLFSEIWQRMPRWLLVAFALIFSLVFLAELAVFLVHNLSGDGPTWEYYIPILGGLVYAICFCCLYVYWDYSRVA